MFRYIAAAVSALTLAYASAASAHDDKFEFSVSDNTPASFFSSGIAVYFFNEGSVGIFQYSKDRLYYGSENAGDISSVSDMLSLMKEQDGKDDLILLPDGSAKYVKNVGDDYACHWDSFHNCLYSDTMITGVDVKNLIGETDMDKIGAGFGFKGKSVKFPVGSKLYRFYTEVPVYDFDEFDDFSSLICSKNDDGMCRAVFSDGVLDMAALFELVHGRGELSGMVFSDTGKNDLAYVYDIDNMTVAPYSASCLENADKAADMELCSRKRELGAGVITERRHEKTGISYWTVDYKNPDTDNLIFWLNRRGEPFKAYTNPSVRKTFNMYNETAAETIFKGM